MKLCRILLWLSCALSISCNASDTKLKKAGVRCPSSVMKGESLPSGSILIGALPASRKKLLSAALVTKTGSNLVDQVWDEETLDWEDGSEGMLAEAELDSTRSDPFLKCSYPGKVDPVKKEYFDVQVLIPIRPKTSGKCKFTRSETETSASCDYKL